ncbi:N-acetylmuramoyl-L-alanine amidase [Sphingosinicella sp. BN140058]|uniref:N-acetylmuramoyl-L-alanine amidase n=1 Tax=Sphingosinicella sp. BN140058 TaxID=1892855 RepID=UPI001012AD04|nr:N-acetylmuramoyl-L-alanine amidase [Sphingosinicella sp. BN140058]QAY78769.1 lysozyme [Sphingosinicella sp. BN140058]
MRKISAIVLHCSATPEGREISASDIDQMHRTRGFDRIGYHYFIRLDGKIEKGRPDGVPGAHVQGHNLDTIGICYAGGVDVAMRPKDTRTQAQKMAMKALIGTMLEAYPEARVCGHRDFPGVNKACPSFDVAAWMAETDLGKTAAGA